MNEISNAEEVADIDGDDVVSIITCTRNHALELLQESAYSKDFICNMCRKGGTGRVYHCKTCEFDAHPDCAVIKKKVMLSFRKTFLSLDIQNYHNDNMDAATCDFCQEPLKDSEWVYKSQQGASLYAHVLCTKYPESMNHLRVHDREHILTLVESPPGKICACCFGNIKGYYYTCKSCAKERSFDLHPFCAILPGEPYCLNDTSHRLLLVTNQSRFRCGKCESSGFSWHYHCKPCKVNRCLDCMGPNIEEDDDDWNMAYKKFTLKYAQTLDARVWDHNMADVISKLVDDLLISDPSEASSSCSLPQVPGMYL